MSLSKKSFYVNKPSGELILVEAFLRENAMTLLFGQDNRIDLSTESAFELADSLLILLSDTGLTNEEY